MKNSFNRKTMNNFISKNIFHGKNVLSFEKENWKISYHKHTLKVATASDAISKFGI